ncbi:MAG TPA: hypothetical protein VIV12_20075 [Streptosporangiaceae bacterium]
MGIFTRTGRGTMAAEADWGLDRSMSPTAWVGSPPDPWVPMPGTIP